MSTELKETIEQLGESFRGFKEKYEQRLEQVELNQNRIPAPGNTNMTAEQKEHQDAFVKWLRNPGSARAKAMVEELQEKAVTIGSDPAGGYAVPEVIAKPLLQQLRELSPIRQIAKVVTAASSDFKYPLDIGGISSGWVGEGGTRNETDTPQLSQRAPTFGTVYALLKASEESMMDIHFDVGQWLRERGSEELSIQEGDAFVNGNGSNKPTGFLDGTPEAVGDNDSPGRTAGELQYIPTGVADGFGTMETGSPPHYPADVLYDTVYTLRAPYRKNAVWLMNSATAGVIRNFKDGDGRYLWTDSLVVGQPATLCGYRVFIDDVGMPDVGADAFPVAFGDFNRGYLVADSFGLRVTVDDNITVPGQCRFYLRKRVGACVLDDNAIKLIRCSES
ncbi:HK97 family phage major capsid protein [Desulfosalsimonas propionicica]|uniref:HK97 family phage major capsid protein n=1 Tax=Desulfosalsimonas propionicica TaxID=332175 RepID=A0A7W0CC96_9BACT|nr:phage major capsid protein [Desulfosalsimonas propionicica]MBA2883065.1 HK97 family phage major capsid protein [Desulfosalsimonas propionicica]